MQTRLNKHIFEEYLKDSSLPQMLPALALGLHSTDLFEEYLEDFKEYFTSFWVIEKIRLSNNS